MNGRNVSAFGSISARSAKSGRRGGHGSNNPACLLAAVVGACLLASPPCDGQIEVNAYIPNFGSSDVSVIDTETNTVVGSPIPRWEAGQLALLCVRTPSSPTLGARQP